MEPPRSSISHLPSRPSIVTSCSHVLRSRLICVASCFRHLFILSGIWYSPYSSFPSISCNSGFLRLNWTGLPSILAPHLCDYYNINYNLGLGPDSALAKSRNCLLKIFPAALFGTWSIMITPPLRDLCMATRPLTHSCISLENAADSVPGCGFTLGTTYALDDG